MDIRQLETFLWIARLGSISEACKRLHVTQSTLSMRLRALEIDLRVPLFDRGHKRLTLTAKGRDLVRYAEKIVETVKQARMYVADPTAQTGTIRVGIAELIALTWAPDLINRVKLRFPNVLMDLDIGVPRTLTEALSNGILDVALAPALRAPEVPLAGFSLGTVRWSWMASPSLRLAAHTVSPTDLETQPIIGVASSQSIFYSVIQQWFTEAGATIQRYNACNSLAASISMVAEGIGIGLLPNEYCAELIRSKQLQVLRATRDFEFEYFAMFSAQGEQALPREVAELAQAASTFEKRGPESSPESSKAAKTRRSHHA
jgi:DNA-binding transcriptional LysR family regulator